MSLESPEKGVSAKEEIEVKKMNCLEKVLEESSIPANLDLRDLLRFIIDGRHTDTATIILRAWKYNYGNHYHERLTLETLKMYLRAYLEKNHDPNS